MRPYLRVANVFEDRLDLRDVMEMNFSPAEFERYELKQGDVLLNEGQTPDLVGRAGMYRGEVPNACFTNSLIRFRPRADINASFALLVFRRHLHTRRFKREARITTNIAHLSAGRLKTVEFPLPPLEEQRRIVAEVEQQLSLIDSLRAAVESAQKRSAALRRAILERAFRGELVPQDPDDEPASVLLERIRGERAAAPPARRRTRV
jgi:type I restriction enzyme S subunit